MLGLVLSTPYICNANQLIGFYLKWIFTEKNFSKQAIKIWILIPIIPRNMFKLHDKKTCTKYNKICAFEINPHKIYHHEKKYQLNDLGFLFYSTKVCPNLCRFI